MLTLVRDALEHQDTIGAVKDDAKTSVTLVIRCSYLVTIADHFIILVCML